VDTVLSGHRSLWTVDDVDVDELAALIAPTTSTATYPHASAVEGQIVVYEMSALPSAEGELADRAQIMDEIDHALEDGPGVVAFRNAVDPEIVARATAVFEQMIDDERRSGQGSGDHFAAAGANERIWNALEKLAVVDPEVFVDYYASEAIALASTAWLGPDYQVTSQINVVNPGGEAQSPHRDYHLGFMSHEQASRFPGRVHVMSRNLTLQGAVAHVDMPVETGPTKLLPHSQKYPLGYLAWRSPAVIELFEREHTQMALTAGDAVFFNPAVLHAAGTNRTSDVRRMGNLLQVSSAFGRAMESIDRSRIVQSVYPALLERRAAGWPHSAIDRVIAASAEGYAFPTNLDRDPPLGDAAPPSQADVTRRAIAEEWSIEQLHDAIADHDRKRRTT
jgi:ectoine hydroxylase-related dioxygenase (phytanoyl-CoA dioxygenase family)